MLRFASFAAATTFVLLGSTAFAQETAPASKAEVDTPAADPNLSLGEEVVEQPSAPILGERYLGEAHGDWVMRCVKTDGETDPCQLFQLLKDSEGNAVAEMSLFRLPAGGQAVAGATIITPLETLLTEQITLSVDGGAARRYPFSFCSQVGCVSRIGLTNEDVTRFKRGAAGMLQIVPAGAPDQKVQLTVSLSGFTAGFEATSVLDQ